MLKNRLLLISAFVVLSHFLIVIAIAWNFSPFKPQVIQPKKLAIQTITLKPQLEKIVAQAPPVISPKSEPSKPLASPKKTQEVIKKPEPTPKPQTQVKKESPPVVKKEPAVNKPPVVKKEPVVAKPQVVKKETTVAKSSPETSKKMPPPKPVVETRPTPSPQELAALERKEKALQLVRENIAKIQAKDDKISTVKTSQEVTVKKVENLISDSILQESGYLEATYQEELVYFLKKKLHLVDGGNVKIKLTLRNTGEVAHFSIVYAESKVNRDLIEKTVPGLIFPSWNKKLSDNPTFTCCVILSPNE